MQVVWGLGLWLAAGDPRSCTVTEERPARRRGPRGPGGSRAGEPGRSGGYRLVRAPVRTRGLRFTSGIVDSGGLAVLATAPVPSQGSAAARTPGLLTLEVTGFGPQAQELAAGLVAHVQAWDQAGQPGVGGLHIDAYPRSGGPAPAHDGLLIERPSIRFAVYHA